MSKDQQIEKAARALAGLAEGDDWPTNEALGGHWALGTRDDEFRDEMRGTATEVLDAILPQITTMAELEALPEESVLLRIRDGYADALEWKEECLFTAKWGWDPKAILNKYGPLTLVFTPDTSGGDR